MLSGSALQGKDRLAPKSTLLKGRHDRATACHAHRGTHGSPPTVLLLLCSALGKGAQYAHGSGTVPERASKPCLPSYRGDGVNYNNATFMLIIAMALRYPHLTGRLHLSSQHATWNKWSLYLWQKRYPDWAPRVKLVNVGESGLRILASTLS